MLDLFFYVGVFLVVLLGCCVAVAKFSKPANKQVKVSGEFVDFDVLMVTIESSDSTYEDLQKVCDILFAHYGELGLSNNQKKKFIYGLSKHPNVTAQLVLSACNEMIRLNPDMEKELNKVMKRGLDRR